MEQRRLFKNVCANVDFYSGFVYTMLGIPKELFTPIFAIARIPGWSAHRLEEILNASKIIRPAYKYVGHHANFVPFEEREAGGRLRKKIAGSRKGIPRTGRNYRKRGTAGFDRVP